MPDSVRFLDREPLGPTGYNRNNRRDDHRSGWPAVPRIPVQAVEIATKVIYRTTASATGEYSIAQLPAGTYQVMAQVSTAAFLPFVLNDLRITPGQTVKLDIHRRIFTACQQ